MNQHAHAHPHSQPTLGKAFAIGISLNVGFVLVELFYGWHANSLALLADAAHNLSDVGGLILAWAAFAASKWRPDIRHTYGWRKGSILASFINAVVLLVAMGSLGWEAFHRLLSPAPIQAGVVMAVAAIGVLINGVTAVLFMSGSKKDLNIRGAFLHMAADALVSIGVVISGALYLWQGWLWLDAVVSLLIGVVVVVGTGSLFKQSLHLLFDGVPADIELAAVHQYLSGLPDVTDVHDLHVWAMSTSETALTVHLVMCSQPTGDSFIQGIAHEMHERFGISHTTTQIEHGGTCQQAASCKVPPRIH